MDETNTRHIASMRIVEREDHTLHAYLQIADEEGMWVEVPPHMAAQLPMVIRMVQNGQLG